MKARHLAVYICGHCAKRYDDPKEGEEHEIRCPSTNPPRYAPGSVLAGPWGT